VHVQLLQLLQVRIHRRRSSRTSAFTLRLSSCGAVATVFPSAPTIPPRSAACGRGALPAGGGARTLRNVKDTRRDGRGTTCYEGKVGARGRGKAETACLPGKVIRWLQCGAPAPGLLPVRR